MVYKTNENQVKSGKSGGKSPSIWDNPSTGTAETNTLAATVQKGAIGILWLFLPDFHLVI